MAEVKSLKHIATSTWSKFLLGSGATITWMFFSSALIILNKNLYSSKIDFPCYVTGMGQIVSAFGGLVMGSIGMMPIRRIPSARFAARNLLPIIISTAASMFFGNAAYLTLSVSFIQILKAFTPAVTLLLCVCTGLEKSTWPLVLSVTLIAGGTGLAAAIESGNPSFHWLGFLSFMLSSITEGSRVVGTEVLIGGEHYNTAEALVYIGGPAGLLLLAFSLVLEAPRGLLAQMNRLPGQQAVTYTVSFLVNLTSIFAIRSTSSLSFKVAGCMKNLIVVWYGVVAHGEHVWAQQVFGYFISVAGFVLYSTLKLQHSSASKQKSRQPPRQQWGVSKAKTL